MRLRIITGIYFGILLIATAIATAKLPTRSNLNTTQPVNVQIPIVIKQLPLSSGVVPVDLQCQATRLHSPKESLVLTCVVKNNTSKSITALSIAYGISFERDNEEFSGGGLLTQDALIHPDFYELNARKFIPPGGEQVIERGEPTEHLAANTSVKSIRASVDYVVFEDGSTLGPNVEGSGVIALLREGAVKYKGWLKQKYIENGKLIRAIVPLLQDNLSLPAELNLTDPMLALGAEAYRKNARDLYQKQGGPELEKRLIR